MPLGSRGGSQCMSSDVYVTFQNLMETGFPGTKMIMCDMWFQHDNGQLW